MRCFLKLTLPSAVAAAGLACAVWTGPANAGTPETYRKQWTDPAVARRIDEGIERNRKGDAVIEVVGAEGRPVAGASLEVAQKTHEFLFGCNAFVLGQLGENNAKYEAAFVKLFNFATVPFYWEGIEPAQGALRYAEGSPDRWRRPPPDRYLPFAKKYGITLKGHPLLWHAYNPPWLPKDPEALKKLYQKRFAEIAPRYAKDIAIWDVVNESLVCPKSYPLFTPDRGYVAWAFRQVGPLFPNNLTMINEVTEVSHQAPARNRYYPQVQNLLKDGLAVKGIGFQFHFFSAQRLAQTYGDPMFAPAALLDVYDHFAKFDLPLYVTEITIPTPPDDGQAVQAEVVGNLYRLWFSAPRMAGITWWNLGDGTAVPGENKAQGGLVDGKLDPKESYHVLDRLINREWKTNLSTKTDAQGKTRLRGFYGKYAVKVTAGGRVQEFEVNVSKDGQATHKLTLKP
jgi:endo-1,4-beta-xylanase